MKKSFFSFSIVLLMALAGCRNNQKDKETLLRNINSPVHLQQAVDTVTGVIVHDVFSPPVASRIYAYSCLAAYEALIPQNSDYQSLAGQLKGFEAVPQPNKDSTYCFPLASLKAFMTIARSMTFSVQKYDDFEKKMYADYKEALPEDVYEHSMSYGEKVGKHVLAYSAKDNYKQTRGFRHTITKEPGTWVPTPPAYMDGVEPQWKTIRTMVLDSASQFAPPKPPFFDKKKESSFYKEMMEVYETGNKLTDEQKHIANFWDCNPFKMNIVGHVMFATKKLSPGGHWMSIAKTVTEKKKFDVFKTTEIYCLLSIGLFDGFISCWDEKYRSLKVRPETAINELIDKDWVPLLQTPPFPEYTSGHSVISAASSVVLTKVIGEDVAFTDSTEVQYGIPPRSFKSFKHAADEASVSRLYGGIHYRTAITAGLIQGESVGKLVMERLHTHKTLAKK
jgi:hypothetical protein